MDCHNLGHPTPYAPVSKIAFVKACYDLFRFCSLNVFKSSPGKKKCLRSCMFFGLCLGYDATKFSIPLLLPDTMGLKPLELKKKI